MKVVMQRVIRASVSIEGTLFSSIGSGMVLLIGIHETDTETAADFLAEKCCNLRFFSDEAGKMNRSLLDIQGEILAVSQFTLLGDCSKGRRPSFITAAPPEKGRQLYDYFVGRLKLQCPSVKTGVFGANMQVELINDGPVTMLLEK